MSGEAKAARFRAAAFALVAGFAGAFWATPGNAEPLVSDEWQFQVTPYLWGLAIHGDVTVKGIESSPSVSFRDIFNDLDYALMAEVEARKGRVGVFVNAIYADLSDDDEAAAVRIRADAQAVWAGAGAYYRFGPWPLDDEAGEPGPRVVLDPYAGARYTYLDSKLKIRNGGQQVDQDKNWVDPIVGFRTICQLTPRWSATVLGDIGGFSVGSDISWQAAGMVGFGFGLLGENDARVLAGYRALYQDFKDGNGSDEFKWDMTLHGPMMALAMEF